MKSIIRKLVLVIMIPVLASFFIISNLSAEKVIVKKKGKGYLGVYIEKMSTDDRDEFGVKFGVLVTKVVESSAAKKAGIKKYDVIQFFNQNKIRRPEDLTDAVRKTGPGSTVKILIVRDGKERNISVTLSKLKEFNQFYPKPGILKENVFKVLGGGAHLGVRIQTMNSDLASYFGTKNNGGALILSVDKDSPAMKAGIKSGDVIIAVDKEKVKNGKDLSNLINKHKPGDKVKINLIRHKKQMPVIAVLGKGLFKSFFGLNYFPKKGEFNVEIPHVLSRDLYFWKEKEGKELKERLNEMKERMKEEKIRMKEELKKVKENVIRIKELKKKELKQVKELKKVKEYIYI